MHPSNLRDVASGLRRGAILPCLPRLSPSQPCPPPIAADLILPGPSGGSVGEIHVFGVDHRKMQPQIGEFILVRRPMAVIVETALTSEHGAVPGTSISCSDQLVSGQEAFYVRMFCQLASQLSAEASTSPPDPSTLPTWRQISQQFRGEQLAYVAAFACGSKLIFGDRPKDITYRRLASVTTIEQLDEAYGFLVESQYRDTLALPPRAYLPDELPIAERIMTQEREAIMCKVVDDACRAQAADPGWGSHSGDVVLVVGDAHLPGLKHLWEDRRWEDMVGKDLSTSPVMNTRASEEASQSMRDEGIKRGLLQAVMRLSVTQEVLDDMTNVLGPVPQFLEPAVESIEEIYACSRMLLATLPQELLSQVCSGYKCNMYEVLEPYRRLRASRGGPIYSDEFIEQIRELNFDIP